MKIFFLTLLIFIMPAICFVQAQGNEELDPLELAALLIKNQNYARAAGVLGEIKDPHEVIPERYWALKGVLELKQKRYDKALEAFKFAQKEGLQTVDLYEGLAEAYLGLKQYEDGLKVLSNHKKLLENRLRYYQLKASLLFESGQSSKGWETLQAGISRFDQELSLIKQKWYYLMENKLYEVSFETAKTMIDQYSISSLDIARMGQMYRSIGEYPKAIFLGEVARLKSPGDEEIVKDLARSYVKVENVTAAARLFTDLAHYNAEYLVEASELWRKAGHSMMAQNLAMDIRDPVAKLKQNITLALLNEDYNKMSLLGDEGQRTSLKEDQDIQYALAYASFVLGDYKKTEEYLSMIQRPDLFKKALALREAMNQCEQEEATCF